VIGHGDDLRPNREEPERLYAGITLVGKRATVPPRITIGRNCRIDPGVTAADFGRRRIVRSGETVVSAG
jgi:glucose-1-phosphate adenylyltransferase